MRNKFCSCVFILALGACSFPQDDEVSLGLEDAQLSRIDVQLSQINAVCDDIGRRNSLSVAAVEARDVPQQLAWVVGSITEPDLTATSREDFVRLAAELHLLGFAPENFERFFSSDAHSYLFKQRSDCHHIRSFTERDRCFANYDDNTVFLEFNKISEEFSCASCSILTTENGGRVYYNEDQILWSERLTDFYTEQFSRGVTQDVFLRPSNEAVQIPFLRFITARPLLVRGLQLIELHFVFASDLENVRFYRMVDENGRKYCGTTQIDEFLSDNYLINW